MLDKQHTHSSPLISWSMQTIVQQHTVAHYWNWSAHCSVAKHCTYKLTRPVCPLFAAAATIECKYCATCLISCALLDKCIVVYLRCGEAATHMHPFQFSVSRQPPLSPRQSECVHVLSALWASSRRHCLFVQRSCRKYMHRAHTLVERSCCANG